MFRIKNRLLTALLLLVLGALPLSASGEEVRVLATTSDLASIAEAVGGDRVHVDVVVTGKRDPHYVEILPSYMLKAKKADIFVMAGLQLELWAPGIIDGARNRDLVIVDCSAGIHDVMEKPAGSVDPSMGDIHAGGNPHYWLDPRNGLLVAEVLRDALIEEDPGGRPEYDRRFNAFEAALKTKLAEWESAMAPYAGAEIVFFHNTWPYFNRAFGLVAAGFVEPKPGISPSPGHTASIIKLIRERGIRVIAIAPFYDHKVCESIARQTGARVVTLATSVGGVQGADDYISLFDTNLSRLRAALEDRP